MQIAIMKNLLNFFMFVFLSCVYIFNATLFSPCQQSVIKFNTVMLTSLLYKKAKLKISKNW